MVAPPVFAGTVGAIIAPVLVGRPVVGPCDIIATPIASDRRAAAKEDVP